MILVLCDPLSRCQGYGLDDWINAIPQVFTNQLKIIRSSSHVLQNLVAGLEHGKFFHSVGNKKNDSSTDVKSYIFRGLAKKPPTTRWCPIVS